MSNSFPQDAFWTLLSATPITLQGGRRRHSLFNLPSLYPPTSPLTGSIYLRGEARPHPSSSRLAVQNHQTLQALGFPTLPYHIHEVTEKNERGADVVEHRSSSHLSPEHPPSIHRPVAS